MSRALSLPHYFHKGKDHRDDVNHTESLAVSVCDNYFTFNGWADQHKEEKSAATITGRLSQNFATFREWGR